MMPAEVATGEELLMNIGSLSRFHVPGAKSLEVAGGCSADDPVGVALVDGRCGADGRGFGLVDNVRGCAFDVCGSCRLCRGRRGLERYPWSFYPGMWMWIGFGLVIMVQEILYEDFGDCSFGVRICSENRGSK